MSIVLSAFRRPLCSRRMVGSGGLLTWSQTSCSTLLVSCACHLVFQAARTFCFSVICWCVCRPCLSLSSRSLVHDSLCSFVLGFLVVLRSLLFLVLARIQAQELSMNRPTFESFSRFWKVASRLSR